MTASPPIAGWLFDQNGVPDSAILFGAALFALVLPVAIIFRMLKTGAAAEPLKETA